MMIEFSGEFYHLKRRPAYPSIVEAVAIAHLYFDRDELCLYFDRSPGLQWVASLWIVDGSCEVDLALVLKEGKLEFIEGYCSHGDFCPKVEELKQAILECPAFDQLLGSRMAVVGAELRFPLLGLFSRRSYYGAFPIEMAFFGDAGTAWTSDSDRPRYLGGNRDWARSAGVVGAPGSARSTRRRTRAGSRSRRACASS